MGESGSEVLVETPLGPDAREYLRSCLEVGHYVAQAVLQRIALDRGRVSTYLPAGVDAASLHDFKSGGKLRQDAPIEQVGRMRVRLVTSADRVLVDLIVQHLATSSNAVVVIEDFLRKSTDVSVTRQRSRLAFLGQEVFFVLVAGDDRAAVEVAVRESKAIPVHIGVFGECSDRLLGVVRRDQLDQVVATTSSLFAGAYDGEGFIMWRLNRTDALPPE